MTKKNAHKRAARAIQSAHGGSYQHHLRSVGGAKGSEGGATMKLEPLKQWVCDTCGTLIASAEDGWLEWFHGEDHRPQGFRICHTYIASPLREGDDPGEGCYQHGRKYGRSDDHLKEFLGVDGMVRLMSKLDIGPVLGEGRSVASVPEWAEIFRRLYVPYYEQARRYFAAAKRDGFYDDVNEYWPYLSHSMKQIIREYEGEDDLGGAR